VRESNHYISLRAEFCIKAPLPLLLLCFFFVDFWSSEKATKSQLLARTMAYYTRLAARNGAKQDGEPMYTPKKATPRKRGITAEELKKKFAAQRAKASVFVSCLRPCRLTKKCR
jgi:hypothetical protein